MKTISLDVNVEDEFICLDGDDNGDDSVAVEFDDALIQRIKELQKVVIDTKTYAIQEFNYVVEWAKLTLNGEPLRVDSESLHVSNDDVWWTCYFKNSQTRISTMALPIAEIVG